MKASLLFSNYMYVGSSISEGLFRGGNFYLYFDIVLIQSTLDTSNSKGLGKICRVISSSRYTNHDVVATILG